MGDRVLVVLKAGRERAEEVDAAKDVSDGSVGWGRLRSTLMPWQ